MIETLTRERISDAMRAKGYAVFESGDMNLNIVGVRATTRASGKFDDSICIFYKRGGVWLFHAYQATTDPGTEWLRKPMRADGAAIMVPGQYRRLWQIGMHQGKVSALVQTGNSVKVYRDNNRDAKLDTDARTVISGYFGINCHPAWGGPDPKNVGLWSAGCQVVQRQADFAALMRICNQSRSVYGNFFTYTLLEQEDLQ